MKHLYVIQTTGPFIKGSPVQVVSEEVPCCLESVTLFISEVVLENYVAAVTPKLPLKVVKKVVPVYNTAYYYQRQSIDVDKILSLGWTVYKPMSNVDSYFACVKTLRDIKAKK